MTTQRTTCGAPGAPAKPAAWIPSPNLAYALLVTTVFIWASQAVIGRGVHDQIPPVGLSFWRWLTGAIIVFPFAAAELYRHRRLILANLRLYFYLGGLVIGGSTLLLTALNFTTATNLTLVNAAQPAATSALGLLFFSQRLAPAQIAGVVIAFAGVVTIVLRADVRVLAGLELNIGDVIMMIANFGYALYALNLRKMPQVLSVHASLFLVTVCGCSLLLPFYVAESIAYRPVAFNQLTVGVIVMFGFFFSVLSIIFWNASVNSVGPVRAAVFVNLLPIFGATLAILFLGEQLFFYHYLGFALVCMGITCVIGTGPKTPPPPRRTDRAAGRGP